MTFNSPNPSLLANSFINPITRYDFNTIMSFVGANMGLWLGIGGLQILRCIEAGLWLYFLFD